MKFELNEVEKIFLDKSFGGGEKAGGTILFPKKVALEFIEECKKRKIPILGIDGFFVGKDIKPISGFSIDENSIQPNQEDSIDFSRSPFNYSDYIEDSIYQKSRQLVESRPDNVYFEIVCGK